MLTRLHYVPICLALFFPLSFGICYAIALELNHINAFFAFISDAGTLPPEQYVFAQLVNMGAAMFAYFAYIRFTQVEQYMKIRWGRRHSISNVIAIAFAFTSCLGMSLVGNFPELYVKEIHYLGAFLAFVGGSIYTVFQGYFTYKMLPHFQTKFIAYFRIFLGVLGLMLYFGAQGAILLAFQRIRNKEKLEETPRSLKWTMADGGYQFRAASVVMEWLLVIIFGTFIVTFIPEFKHFRLEEPTVSFFVHISSVSKSASEEEMQGDEDDMRNPSPSDNMTSMMSMPMSIQLEGESSRYNHV